MGNVSKRKMLEKQILLPSVLTLFHPMQFLDLNRAPLDTLGGGGGAGRGDDLTTVHTHCSPPVSHINYCSAKTPGHELIIL